jgi:hypothetical protein
VRRAGARKDHVRRIERNTCAIRVDDRDIRPRCERGSRRLGECRVDLDCGDLAGGANKLGSDTCVVSGPAAEMEYLFASRDTEVVEQIGPKARLSVVDAAGLV